MGPKLSPNPIEMFKSFSFSALGFLVRIGHSAV